MRRAIVALVALLLDTSTAEAATWYARAAGANTTGPADSCASADVQAAVTAASSGDTVQVGAGSCTWTVPVSNLYNGGVVAYQGGGTAKYVKIQGSGSLPAQGAATSGGTTLTDNVAEGGGGGLYHNLFLMVEPTTGNAALSNFTVNLPSGYPKFSVIGWESVVVNPGVAGAKVNVMHHMTFNDTRDTVQGEQQIIRASTGRGVIYRNQFLRGRAVTGYAVFRCGMSGGYGHPAWKTVSSLGALDTGGDLHLYFEDNVVNNYPQNSADAACRVVFRGNRGENWSYSGHGRDSQSPGSRQLEAYLNTHICAGDGAADLITAWSALRGAVQMILKNTMGAATHGAGCRSGAAAGDIVTSVYLLRQRDGTGCFLKSDGTPGVYPAPQMFGWGYTTGATSVDLYGYDLPSPSAHIAHDPDAPYLQDLEGSYLLLNYRADGTTKTSSDGVTADGALGFVDQTPDTCLLGSPSLSSTDFIHENREWYKQNDSFTGATGIGIGVRASRPATCTTGVGYWSTDQGGHWNTTTSATNDGTLDKCTAANTWTNAFYTPKTYPHALATSTSDPGTASHTLGGGQTIGRGVTIR